MLPSLKPEFFDYMNSMRYSVLWPASAIDVCIDTLLITTPFSLS